MLQLTRWEFTELELEIHCGSGTYVRAIGRDLARDLGTEAVMTSLVRDAIGPFTLADALDPAALTREALPSRLLPLVAAVPDLPRTALDEADIARIVHGQAVHLAAPPASREAAGMSPSGELMAILVPTTDGRWRPDQVFQTDEQLGAR